MLEAAKWIIGIVGGIIVFSLLAFLVVLMAAWLFAAVVHLFRKRKPNASSGKSPQTEANT